MCDVGKGECGNYTKTETLAGKGAVCHAIQGEGICTYGAAAAKILRGERYVVAAHPRTMVATLAL